MKCELLSASRAAPWRVTLSICCTSIKVDKDRTDRRTDGRTDGRQIVTLHLLLDAANTTQYGQNNESSENKMSSDQQRRVDSETLLLPVLY